MILLRLFEYAVAAFIWMARFVTAAVIILALATIAVVSAGVRIIRR